MYIGVPQDSFRDQRLSVKMVLRKNEWVSLTNFDA